MKVRSTELEPSLDLRMLRRTGFAFALLFALSATALGCGGSGDLPLDEVDPNAAPANPTYDQIFAILHNNCTTCHTGGGDDGGDDEGGGYAVSRSRATTGDASPDLGDCFDIVAFSGDILEQVESDQMPPGAMPRLTSAEKLTISRWVLNGTPAPCN
jgi:mono/diheme cytochrome c family protein